MFFPIGDIHGCYDLVATLYDEIRLRIEAGIDPVYGGTIVFLGDYIDRGPQSKEVLDFLMGLEDTDEVKHVFLKGNHEEFMIHNRFNPDDVQAQDVWLRNGGADTMRNFGITMNALWDGEADTYVDWMMKLPYIAQDPDYVFVHAAVNTNLPLTKQHEHYCVWHTERYKEKYKDLRKIVVHGHMARRNGPVIDIKNKRIWMDVGANMFGQLATITLPEPLDGEADIETIWVKE